jgi:hypothetical protein
MKLLCPKLRPLVARKGRRLVAQKRMGEGKAYPRGSPSRSAGDRTQSREHFNAASLVTGLNDCVSATHCRTFSDALTLSISRLEITSTLWTRNFEKLPILPILPPGHQPQIGNRQVLADARTQLVKRPIPYGAISCSVTCYALRRIVTIGPERCPATRNRTPVRPLFAMAGQLRDFLTKSGKSNRDSHRQKSQPEARWRPHRYPSIHHSLQTSSPMRN